MASNSSLLMGCGSWVCKYNLGNVKQVLTKKLRLIFMLQALDFGAPDIVAVLHSW